MCSGDVCCGVASSGLMTVIGYVFRSLALHKRDGRIVDDRVVNNAGRARMVDVGCRILGLMIFRIKII